MTKQTKKKFIPWSLLGIYLLSILALSLAGYSYYRSQERIILESVNNQLKAVVQLKSRQIEQWRIERLDDAELLRANIPLARDVYEYSKNKKNGKSRSELLQWMKAFRDRNEYESILLINPDGTVLLSDPPENNVYGTFARTTFAKVVKEKKIILTDIHSSEVTTGTHLDLFAPLFIPAEKDTQLVGIVHLRIKPDNTLFPLLQSWPTESPTSETFLFRPEGDSIVYLSALRQKKNESSVFKLSINDSLLITAQFARGAEDVYEGVNYNGVRVHAYGKKIPNTPWYMAAMINEDEVNRPIVEEASEVSQTIALIVIAAGALMGLWWRNLRARQYKQELLSEREKQLLSRQIDYLVRYAHDIIILFNKEGTIVEVNDQACKSHGYSREELLKLSINNLRPVSVQNQIQKYYEQLTETEGKIFESIHVTKEEKEFPVEISARLFSIDNEVYYQSIIRDISDRKKNEEELKASEEQYRSLFSAIEDMTVVHELVYNDNHQPIDYRIIDCNEKTASISGISKEQIIGKLGTVLHNINPPPYFDIYVNVVETGTPVQHETYYEEQKRYLNTSIFSHKPGQFVTISRDITQLKQQQESILHLQRLYALLSQTNQAIVRERDRNTLFRNICLYAEEFGKFPMASISIQQKDLEGVLQTAFNGEEKNYFAQAWKQFSNLPEHQAYQTDDTVIVNNIHHAETVPSWEKLAAEHRLHSVASTPIHCNKIPIGALTLYSYEENFFGMREVNLLREMALDISFALDTFELERERLQTERSLKESEYRYRSIFENHAAVKLLIDLETQQIVEANHAAEKFYGWSREQLTQMKIYDLNVLPPNETHKHLSNSASGIKNNFEFKHRLADGSIRDIEVFSGKIEIDGKKFVHAIVYDIAERKIAEAALRESEHKLREVFDTMEEGLALNELIFDEEGNAVDYKILEVNTAYERIVQRTRNKTIGKRATEVYSVQPIYIKEFWEKHRNSTVSMKEEIYFSSIKKWLKLSTSRIEKNRFVRTFSDITEQKRAEFASKESAERYRKLVENVREAYYEADSRSLFTYCNPGILHIGGYTEEELIGTSVFRLVAEEDRSHVIAQYKQWLKEKRSDMVLELRVVTKKGEKFWVEQTTHFDYDENGNFLDATNYLRNIEERKKSEEQIRKLSLAIEQSVNSVVITDTTGAIEYVNPMFTKITGYSFEEAAGRNPNMLQSGTTPLSKYEELWGTITAGSSWRGEIQNRRKNGELYWEEVTISPIKNEFNVITHYIAIQVDVTERKNFERELLQSQKIQSIGTLAAGIAHDFNNVLGIILGYAEVIGRNKHNPEKVHDSLEIILRTVDRGAGLVRQILTFARKTDTSILPLSIKEVIRELISMLRQTFPKLITISESFEPEIPYIYADRTKIHQALLNLSVNARDAMPEGGTLTFKIRKIKKEKLLERYKEVKHNVYLDVSVSDTGTGINENIKSQIFDPFFTTKDPGKGTGLGLSVGYGIVQAHDGVIDVESEEGKGTTFHLYLPVSEHHVEAEIENGKKNVMSLRCTETILIVEDEETLRNMLHVFLENKGYTVFNAKDGEEAIAVYKERQQEIDLVVTDMGLPKISGVEEYKILRQINPEVRVICASGFFEPHIKSELLKLGVKAFVQKPYESNEIARVVREVLNSAQ